MLKNEKGFTLIEMMIVLLVISVLLIITVPNVTSHNSKINEKGCDAYVKMVQGQVQAYEMENHEYPESAAELVNQKYLIEDEITCPNGNEIEISSEGIVKAVPPTTTSPEGS